MDTKNRHKNQFNTDMPHYCEVTSTASRLSCSDVAATSSCRQVGRILREAPVSTLNYLWSNLPQRPPSNKQKKITNRWTQNWITEKSNQQSKTQVLFASKQKDIRLPSRSCNSVLHRPSFSCNYLRHWSVQALRNINLKALAQVHSQLAIKKPGKVEKRQ